MEHSELRKEKAQGFVSSGEYSPSLTECFIGGAEWEYEHLIEKASKWFEENIVDDVMVSCGSVIKCINVDEFCEYFRRSMEK